MAENRENSRKILSILFLLMGCLSMFSVLVISPLVIENKMDIMGLEVESMRVTFEKIDYEIKYVDIEQIGKELIIFNLTIGSDIYTFYSEQTNIVVGEIGIAKWKDGDFLLISSTQLQDDDNYFIESGKIIYLNIYGNADESKPVVIVDNIRESNWLDDLFQKNSIVISIIVGLLIVTSITFFALPLAPFIIKSVEDYYIYTGIPKSKRKNQEE